MESNELAAIAAQALYGNNFETVTPGAETDPNMMINLVAEQQNRFGYALFSADHSYEVATAMGLAWVDDTALPTEQYLYRVFPASDSIQIDTGFTYVDPTEQFLLPKVLELQADFEDKRVTVSWNKELFRQFYVSYLIEKSADGVRWASIHDSPFINTDRGPRGERYAYIVDSLEENNRPYFYRVSGRTPFDSYGPPSDIVQGMGIDAQPSYYPSIDGVYESTQGAFNVQWIFDSLQNDKITGFYVQRAPRDEGPYEYVSDLLPAEVRSFIDPSPLSTNYYKVVAMDAYGREMPSFTALAQLYDETSPAPPQNVRGKIMEDGTLVITWDPNTEEDFYGNRVFIANDSTAEFTQITPDPTTKGYFIDSVGLNTLSEKLFVKVTSQDYRANTSGFSEMAVVTRPDSIAPSAPTFNSFETGVEIVSLGWANSSSHDLSKTTLKRRAAGTEMWVTVAEFSYPEDANITYFDDETVEAGSRYEYQLTATDDADLSTDSRPLQVQTLRDLEADPIANLNITADRRQKVVNLNWQYADDRELRYFRIYRCLADGIPISYKTVAAEDALLREASGNRLGRYGFADDAVNMNTTYLYQVKAVFEGGKQSPKSEILSIDY